MSIPTQITGYDHKSSNDFIRLGYIGKYNYILHLPPGTSYITLNKNLMPDGFVIINDDLEIEAYTDSSGDGLILQGSQFDTSKNWIVHTLTVQRITTNSLGEAYLLYNDSIYDLVTDGDDTDTIKIITESGIYILTETGFKLLTED